MRRTTRFLATATALWTVLGVGGPAAAGGWWSGIPLEGSELGVGERFETGRGEVLFESVEAAARARQGLDRYYAYLIPNLDWSIVDEAMSIAEPGDWWIHPETRIRAGEVEVTGGPSNLARIRISFAVPAVEPGTYALMLCTAGCVRPLADVVPHEVTVAADAATARIGRRLTELQGRVHVVRSRLGHRVSKLERELRVLRSRGAAPEQADALEAAEGRVSRLERRVAELEGAAPALAWLVVGAAGAALLILLPRRRRPRERPPTPPRVVEMELVEPPEMEPEPDPDRTPVPAA